MDSMISKSVFALERITLNGQAVPAAELQGLFSPDFAATARGSNVYQRWEAYYRHTDKTLYLLADKVREPVVSMSALYLRTANSSAAIYGMLRFKYRSKKSSENSKK